MSTHLSPDQILTVKEVADYLKLSDSTIYRLVNHGQLPGRKIGGTWRFSRQIIDSWLCSQQETVSFLEDTIDSNLDTCR